MQEEVTTLAVGTTIRDPAGDEYIVERLLGRGGFGAVYLVRNRRFRGSLFALKEVSDPNKRDRESFFFEGEVLKQLHHWALPHVYRVFKDNKLKRVYMLMDYVQGKNLETLRREQPERRFALPLVLTLMAPIVDALIFLHQQDPPIVHRDLKPANIIVTEKAHEAMLVDFGLAKQYVAENTTTVIRQGSPGYAAPEQYGSGTTPQTDIYGLGATFYTLLTGIVPVDAITRVTKSKGSDPVVPASLITSDVPTGVAKTLQRAMSIGVGDRYSTIEEFWQELTAHVPELQISAPSLPTSLETQPLLPFKQGDSASLRNQIYTPRLENRGVRRGVLLLIILTLLLIGIIGTSFSLYLQIIGNHASNPSIHRSTPGETPAAPTTGSKSGIAGMYKGTILDLATNSTTSMVLRGMRQNQGRISGYLIVGPKGPKIQGNGSLRGTIDANNQFQFIVMAAGGPTVLFFQGVMQSPTSLGGDFYSCSSGQAALCSQVPGNYGTWNVVLVS